MDNSTKALLLDIFIYGLALLAALDLITGVRRGRLRLVSADRSENAITFWCYAALEAGLAYFALSLWLYR